MDLLNDANDANDANDGYDSFHESDFDEPITPLPIYQPTPLYLPTPPPKPAQLAMDLLNDTNDSNDDDRIDDSNDTNESEPDEPDVPTPPAHPKVQSADRTVLSVYAGLRSHVYEAGNGKMSLLSHCHEICMIHPDKKNEILEMCELYDQMAVWAIVNDYDYDNDNIDGHTLIT
jgi:hypothetical protein